MKGFILGRIKSIQFAFKGMVLLLKTEHSIIVQSFIAILLLFLGYYFKISRIEWIIQLMIIGMVLAIEGLNTAVEKLCDFVHPDFHERIGFIKDISAGAVSFMAIFSFIAICIIYTPYFFNA